MPYGAQATKRRRNPETYRLGAILKYLQLHRLVGWAMRVNVGKGWLIPHHKMLELQKRFGMTPQQMGASWMEFGLPGMSDTIGQMKDGRFLAVEVKTDRGKLSIEQQVFGELVVRNHGVFGVARDLPDVDEILR